MVKSDVKRVYDFISGSWNSFRKQPQKKVLDFYDEFPKTGYFLDIGCGSGRHTKVFSRDFFSVGLDISKKMVELAGKNDRNSFYVQADFCHLPFKDNVFDKTLCYAVLHHLNKTEQLLALKELKRVCTEKSKSLISVWKKWQRKFFFKSLFSNEVYVKWGRHRRYYYLFSKSDFVKTIKKAGLRIKSLDQDKMNFFAITIY